MDSKYVCPCGLTCCDCLFHKNEIYETALKLKRLILNYELDKFLGLISKNGWKAMEKQLLMDENQGGTGLNEYFEPFRQLPEFLNVLDAIIKLQCKTTCQEAGGCLIGGVTHVCGALKCIRSKGYAGCWECKEFKDCDKLTFLKLSYGDTIEGNLKMIKENGVESVKSRGNKYYAWQRRNNEKHI